MPEGHNKNGEWGNPKPFEISGIKAGAAAGRVVTDMVMIYRTPKAVERYTSRSVSMGISVRYGGSPRRRKNFVGPEPEDKNLEEILTYTPARAILIGAAGGTGGSPTSGDGL